MKAPSPSPNTASPRTEPTRSGGETNLDPHAALLNWYARNRRDLPWRQNADPYRVLISVVMLQQTQVERVIPYFERFVARFPSFAALAAAPRADVIQLWAGLGYNRRAAQLHELARRVIDKYGGELPADAAALAALPGIGPYTAGALLSIAFGQDAAALDTNVRRVVARYCFEDEPTPAELRLAAQDLVPSSRAGDWNQALMDLGSSICTGQRPRCLLCPLQAGCRSAGQREKPLRLVRKPQGPFIESTRFYRGRLLAELRDLPAGTTAPLTQVARQLAAKGVAEPPIGWDIVGEGLARDGLARIEEAPDGVTLGLA